MAKWKLARQTFGNEEFTFSEGDEVTVGRGANNNITLSSLMISRNHCVINVQKNQVLITDLKSSNGVYVGLKKIPQNTPYSLKDSDLIGLGWTIGAPLVDINDNEKYVFKLIQETCMSLSNRMKFQSDTEFEDNKEQKNEIIEKIKSPQLHKTQTTHKRKADENFNTENIKQEIKKEKKPCPIITIDDDVISILSDSDNDACVKQKAVAKKPKLEPLHESPHDLGGDQIKTENEYLQYEAFNVKQEYLGYDDEPIQVDSESDSESEHWLLRLSQNSPGKPFIKIRHDNKAELKQEDCSYSQMDELIGSNSFIGNNDYNEELFEDDLITIPPQPPDEMHTDQKIIPTEAHTTCVDLEKNKIADKLPITNNSDAFEEFADDIIILKEPMEPVQSQDEIDGSHSKETAKQIEKLPMVVPLDLKGDTSKRMQIIEPHNHIIKGKFTSSSVKTKSSSSKYGRVKKHSSSKRHISSTEKEERKKKLKEIAEKEKCNTQNMSNNLSCSTSKSSTNVKITSSNRGAFLTDAVQVVKPQKRKEDVQEQPNKEKTDVSPIIEQDIEEQNSKKKSAENVSVDKQKSKYRDKYNRSKTKSTHDKSKESPKHLDTRIPLKSLKPLSDPQDLGDSEKMISGKPFSKVEPLPPKKPKKKVSFSTEGPQVHIFVIEPGNKMKKTSMVKTSLVDIRQTPVFSLEKITLMKILRWNPHWLEEQINNNDPPPILGHNNPPMAIFHAFENHNQYVQLVGDLLLMEIWECLTLAYMKLRHQNNQIEMRIESLPPAPSPDRCFELFNISVNMTVPSSESRNVPRVGEIILVTFGPDSARNQRFFFVHNVRCLPSPPSNKNSFFSISLHATFTEKMKILRRGEVIFGKTLAYINKELTLFEAMEYLAGSPLSDVILKPERRHFPKIKLNPASNIKSQWTVTLNASQQTAVNASVAAALSDKPCIQMVQGPPGTGKSSVICAMVMSYFYDASGKRHQNRGKILICATSNAAVDELVIRLLNIRQRLPKSERFRMVRVGRAEAMHPRAHEVSSQQLAQRDAARAHDAPAHHAGLHDEIFHLQAKVNMWKTAALDAKDPVRVAYCQTRITELQKRITLVRTGSGGGGGGELRADQLAQAERRIVEGAHIIVTTLASAHNHKMRGLKRQIALCIIDEAGQAIEPETLIPLTLDVTHLTLIGDPQQLPGYICSQRAKKHGLGESLFSRLSSCAEQWPGGNPVVLLNQQYRMHPDIVDYPNRAFYDSKIQTVALPRPPLTVPPYSIISIASGDKGQSVCGANEMEAWGVSRLVVALHAAARSLSLSLALITPYNAHKDLIKKNLRMLQDPNDSAVEVNTVDSFQGQERDVVVVSLARSQGVGFLTDAGRMNVMLTRAKHALLICLNPHAMLKNDQWRTLIQDAQRRNMYKVLPTKMCQPASATRSPPEDILHYLQTHSN